MGTIAYLTAFYFIRVLFWGLFLGPLKLYTKYGHRMFEKMRIKLFFGEIFLILIEGYLDFVIAFFLYVKYDEESS